MLMAVIVVDTALDSLSREQTSLRAAIEQANANSGPDEIRFAIPGEGPHVIQILETPLPALVDDGTTIDGYTQPGSSRNTQTIGDDAVIRIQIDGGQLPAAANSSGLTINSSNNDISGLAITNFGGDFSNRFGLVIAGNGKTVSGNHIHGNFIGLDPDGSTPQGNTIGVGVRANYAGLLGSPGAVLDNFIGLAPTSEFSPAAQRNLIAGANDRAGISSGVLISGPTSGTGAASSNAVAGNYLGTDRTGDVSSPDLANIYGVRLQLGASFNRIGGGLIAQRNVIGGNPDVTDAAILIENDGSSNNVIIGNDIGIGADGEVGSLSSRTGIGINGLRSATASIRDTIISGNRIHQTAFDGIFLFGAQTGDTLIVNNEIVGSGDDGVSIVGDSRGNRITENSIFDSGANETGGLDIDLNDDGRTDNDDLDLDLDDGANGLQNFPVIMFALNNDAGLEGESSVDISGALNSAANSTYTIELFSDLGEIGLNDKQFIGSVTVTTNASGTASFQFTATTEGSFLGSRITAVAIDEATGDTSEFSDPVTVVDAGGEGGSSIAGFVYQDLNDDGIKQENEPGIPGVTLTLFASVEASYTAVTGANGAYVFPDLPADRYILVETQPAGLIDGKETAGSAGGDVSVNDQIRDIVLGDQVSATGYLFGERPEVVAPSFVVTNTNDSGAGSLRQVLTDANSFPGRDRITFNIPGAGPFVIRPGSALPPVTESVVIDATTQPGFNGSPVVVINGAQAGEDVDGLAVNADRTEIVGFVIQAFAGCGIALRDVDLGVIRGNWIGLSTDGRSADGNLLDGVCVFNSAGNTIGGSTAADRNVISGNGSAALGVASSGIHVRGPGSRNNLVEGNFIGTNADGSAPVGNSAHGVFIGDLADSTLIRNNLISANGGAVPGAGVFISARDNDESPIFFSSYAGNRVEANFIGTNAAGNAALHGSRVGVVIDDLPNNVIVNNVISGNDFMGVLIARTRATNNRAIGNLIGTDLTGRFAVPNGGRFDGLGVVGDGVGINNAPNNTIGGFAAGEPNLIAGNLRFGTNVFGPGAIGNAAGPDLNLYGTAITGRRLPNGSGTIDDIFLNNGDGRSRAVGQARGAAATQSQAQGQNPKTRQIAKLAPRLKHSLKRAPLVQSGAKPQRP